MRGCLKFSGVILTLFIFPLGIYYLYLTETGNFHAITPGEAYRSAQFDSAKLVYYIKTYKIKSILNLRGEEAGSKWYRDEMKISAENNVAHYDVSLSAYREPTEDDVKKLMTVFMSAPRPILIHCQAGADRSGLVAAMWKVIVDRETKTDAEKQLSVWFGHIPIGATYVLDRFFYRWEPESN